MNVEAFKYHQFSTENTSIHAKIQVNLLILLIKFITKIQLVILSSFAVTFSAEQTLHYTDSNRITLLNTSRILPSFLFLLVGQ